MADLATGRAGPLLERLYFQPFLTGKDVEEITGLTTPNANRLIDRFLALGLLTESTGQKRNRRFVYSP